MHIRETFFAIIICVLANSGLIGQMVQVENISNYDSTLDAQQHWHSAPGFVHLEGQPEGEGKHRTSKILYDGKLYFSAARHNRGCGGVEYDHVGHELFWTDGLTLDGVYPEHGRNKGYQNIREGNLASNPTDFIIFEEELYFVADFRNAERRILHRLSPAGIGVPVLAPDWPTTFTNCRRLTIHNGRLYFISGDADAGTLHRLFPSGHVEEIPTDAMVHDIESCGNLLAIASGSVNTATQIELLNGRGVSIAYPDLMNVRSLAYLPSKGMLFFLDNAPDPAFESLLYRVDLGDIADPPQFCALDDEAIVNIGNGDFSRDDVHRYYTDLLYPIGDSLFFTGDLTPGDKRVFRTSGEFDGGNDVGTKEIDLQGVPNTHSIDIAHEFVDFQGSVFFLLSTAGPNDESVKGIFKINRTNASKLQHTDGKISTPEQLTVLDSMMVFSGGRVSNDHTWFCDSNNAVSLKLGRHSTGGTGFVQFDENHLFCGAISVERDECNQVERTHFGFELFLVELPNLGDE